MQQAACSNRAFLAGSAAGPAAGSSSSSGGAGRRAAAARRAPLRVAATADVQQPSSSAAKEALEAAADRTPTPAAFDARAFRRSLNATGRYTRKPSNDPESLNLMEEHGVGYSTTGLVAQIRETGYAWKQGDVNVKLAEAYGFCWGVERAVQMAYEARKAYPGQRLHITNEIIHNPGGC
jgi:4-hydroxy-3-methylbut-2-enyl diphosphate reductase